MIETLRSAVRLRPSLLLALALLSACTSVPQPLLLDNCSHRYLAFEDFAAQRGVTVSDPQRVYGFPSLGTNRSLASFDPRELNSAQRLDWLERLQMAGVERRRLLHRMLADSGDQGPPHGVTEFERQSCAESTLAAAQSAGFDWQSLLNAVQLEDDYLVSRRALGLYPISAIFAGFGVSKLQDSIYQSYALPLSELPVQGHLRRYSPRNAEQARGSASLIPVAPDDLPRDSLGLLLTVETAGPLHTLFERHAPTLELDELGPYDIPGEPYYDDNDVPRVATESSLAYYYPSLMPFAGELRLQLNYVFWFDKRPAGGPFDSLSGQLDGVVWRVTLDGAGQVLLYDSIHPCGCYHQFFLGERVASLASNAELGEPPLLPQRAPPGTAPVLRLSSGAHYLQRVYATALAAPDAGAERVYGERVYELRKYGNLYTRKSAQGRKSLFDGNGLVPGTERGERFYLWPMGIRSPGAMRERGRQPTAFVGRRHFDDADLFDRLFELRPR